MNSIEEIREDLRKYDDEILEIKRDIIDKKSYKAYLEAECFKKSNQSCIAVYNDYLLRSLDLRRKQAKERILFEKNCPKFGITDLDKYKSYHQCLVPYLDNLVAYFKQEQSLISEANHKLSDFL